MRKMSFPSNSSWYDTVNIIVMGLLVLFLTPCKEQEMSSYNTAWMCVALFAMSYLVGLIFHKIVEWISDKPLKLINKKNEDNAKKKAMAKTEYNLGNRDFYDCYYMLSKENMLGVVDVLEAQIAFIKNSIVMICLYMLFAFIGRFDDINWYVENKTLLLAFALMLIFLSCWTWEKITFRRCMLVWLGGIHLLKNENINQTNNCKDEKQTSNSAPCVHSASGSMGADAKGAEGRETR